MNKTVVISAISLIAVVMVVGVMSPAMANNGDIACEKSGNAKACEATATPTPTELTCLDCLEKYYEDLAAGSPTAISDFHSCNDLVERTSDEVCQDVPPGGF